LTVIHRRVRDGAPGREISPQTADLTSVDSRDQIADQGGVSINAAHDIFAHNIVLGDG
jgi:hypothetical protein